MSVATRLMRVLSSALLNAPVVGAAYMTALYALGISGPLVPADEVLLGRSATEISSFIAVRFAVEIRTIGATLGLLALGTGATLGVGGLAVLQLRRALRASKARLVGPRAALASLALVFVIHAGLVLASMARWPQLYSPSFYAKEGLRADLQIFVTDRLHASGAAAVLALTLLLVVAGSPRRWSAHATRILDTLHERPRRVVGVGALVAAIAIARAADGVDAPISTALAPPAVRRADAAKRPNVLVLAADGLRFDRLRADRAPRLSALADRGTRFDRAYVSLPRTLASWTTIFTGQYSHHHGLRSAFPRWQEVTQPRETLPARLSASGYVTAAVSDYAGDVFRKADFGFTTTRAPKWDFAGLLWQRGILRATPLLPFVQTRVARKLLPEIEDMPVAADPSFVADDAIRTMRDAAGSPFFMVVFFSTTHFPYAAPAPYFERFTKPGYTGPFRYEKQVGAGVALIPDAADVEQIRGLYDGGVAAVDDASARILDELARLGLADDTIVVITSDHGETLFEHQRWHGHGDHLFGDEAVHVPLAIYDPRSPVARRETAVVSSVDLAPTLFALTGVVPPAGMDGRSLADALRGAPVDSRIAFAETELWMGWNPGLPEDLRLPPPPLLGLLEVDTDHGTMVVVRREAALPNLVARHRMARDGRYKLLYMPTPAGPEWRLFDTLKDPDELVDVKDEAPADAARLREALFAWMLEDTSMTRVGDRLVIRGR
jgi:arylsulfatase A-like enzyme